MIKLIAEISKNGKAKRIDTTQEIGIVAAATKLLTGSLNSCALQLYNLAPESRDFATSYGARVSLYFERDGVRSLVITGGVKYGSVKRSGADIITDIFVETGTEYINLPISQKFPAGRIDQVVRSIAQQTGLKCSSESVYINGQTGANGTVLTGTLGEVLDDLGEVYGFSWSIQDGEFLALDDNSTTQGVTQSTAKIISVGRVVESLEENGGGINVLLTADVMSFKIGQSFSVRSSINPGLSGSVFKCHKIVHKLNSISGEFTTELTGFEPGKAYRKKVRNV